MNETAAVQAVRRLNGYEELLETCYRIAGMTPDHPGFQCVQRAVARALDGRFGYDAFSQLRSFTHVLARYADAHSVMARENEHLREQLQRMLELSINPPTIFFQPGALFLVDAQPETSGPPLGYWRRVWNALRWRGAPPTG